MNNIFSEKVWEDYIYWQMIDKTMVKKINDLIRDINRNGLSKPDRKARTIKA